MIEINYHILLIQMVSFLIAIAILWKVAWNPLLEFLNNRKKAIEDDIEKAKDSREKAIKLEEEFDKKLRGIEEKANEIISEAVKEGNSRKEEIIREAKEEFKKILENAKTEIEEEKEKMKKEIQNEAAGLAVILSEKILKKSIDKKVQEEILDDFIKRLNK